VAKVEIFFREVDARLHSVRPAARKQTQRKAKVLLLLASQRLELLSLRVAEFTLAQITVHDQPSHRGHDANNLEARANFIFYLQLFFHRSQIFLREVTNSEIFRRFVEGGDIEIVGA